MNCSEKLVAFMEGKKAKIVKTLGAEFGELYFTEEDAKELRLLPEGQAIGVYLKIASSINQFRMSGLNNALCPFCQIVENKCRSCKYAKRHKGGCVESGSDYDRLYDQFNAKGKNSIKMFSNKFYETLIKRIEKEKDL